MRKRRVIAFLIACTAFSATLMSACTASPDKTEAKPAATANSVNSPNNTADDNSKIFNGKDSKEQIEALISSKAMADKKTALAKEANGKGYEFDMSYGEDEKHNPLLVLKYTARNSISEENKKLMEDSLEEKSGDMDNLALSIQQNMGISNAGVRVIVEDSNGVNRISNDYSGRRSNPSEPEIPPQTESGVQPQDDNQTGNNEQNPDNGDYIPENGFGE